MISRPVVVLILAVLLAAAAVYRLDYAVDALERELARTRERIEMTRADLGSLRASWAYLTRPERLARLAASLGMVPVSSERIVAVESIGTARELELAGWPVPARLPSGEAIELRLRPPLPLLLQKGERR